MNQQKNLRTFGASGPSDHLTHPQAPSVDSLPGPFPGASGGATVSISLVNQPKTELCPFWVGLFRKGPLPPAGLLASLPLRKALHQAVDPGLQADSPIMLADAAGARAPVALYLLPPPPEGREQSLDFARRVTTTLKGWKPPRIGLWMAPDLTGESQALVLLRRLLLQNILDETCREYYLLTEGTGSIPALNVALSLKSEVGRAGTELTVYH